LLGHSQSQNADFAFGNLKEEVLFDDGGLERVHYTLAFINFPSNLFALASISEKPRCTYSDIAHGELTHTLVPLQDG
jgi:hypothetical protein